MSDSTGKDGLPKNTSVTTGKDDELFKAACIDEGSFHELLMTYGVTCEEQGVLSSRAVTIRMDIATHYNNLTALKHKQEAEEDK